MKVGTMYNTKIVDFVDKVKHLFNIYLNEVTVFEVNNKLLRSKVQSELQDLVNNLIKDVPELFSKITVDCNEINNSIEIIENNKLSVDTFFEHADNKKSMKMTLTVGL